MREDEAALARAQRMRDAKNAYLQQIASQLRAQRCDCARVRRLCAADLILSERIHCARRFRFIECVHATSYSGSRARDPKSQPSSHQTSAATRWSTARQ